MINKSESVSKLAEALAKAQGMMGAAKMDSTNPFLKNKYADLGSVIQAAKEPLSTNGLSYSQHPEMNESYVSVGTILMHSSGEWIESYISLALGDSKGLSLAQSAGAVITYLRRYSLSAILGIYTDEDTDGNDGKTTTKTDTRKPVTPPAPVTVSDTSLDKKADTAPVKVNGKQKLERPMAPEVLKDGLAKRAATLEMDSVTCKDIDRNMVAANIDLMFAGRDKVDDIRHAVLAYLTGKSSVKDLTPSMVIALRNWINAAQDSGGQWMPDKMSTTEAHAVETAALEAAGQASIFEPPF